MSPTVKLRFPCERLELEGILHLPEGAGPHPTAVVCHPHPLYGGDMQNNVVSAVCAALPPRGWAALRFNFRGVGGSDGAYGEGQREQEDVVAAVNCLAGIPELDGNRVAVAGYSFGAWVGLTAAAKHDCVVALVAISPPLPSFDFEFLVGCPKPKLLLYGDRDEYVDRTAMQSLLSSMCEPKDHYVFPGVDHFWLARERLLADAVAGFLERLSAAAGNDPQVIPNP